MSLERSMPKDFAMDISTCAISHENNSIPLYASVNFIANSYYIAHLYSVENRDHSFNPSLGYIKFQVITKMDSIIYPDYKLPYIYINYMQNTTSPRYSHIGIALYECAMRFNLEQGCDGRMVLDAVRNSHYFHYLNGFRKKSDKNYYYSLAGALFQAGDNKINWDLGSAYLYLPRKSIEENIKKFGIKYELPDFETETVWQRKLIENSEKIIKEATPASLAFKTIMALKQGYGSIDLSEKPIESYEDLSQMDDETYHILTTGADIMLDHFAFPIDTPEKEKALVVVLTGTMIYAIAYHDKKHGKQGIYNNDCLFEQEHSSSLAIFNVNDSHKQNIITIGKNICIEKSVSYSGVISADFFPALKAIPDLQSLILKILHHKPEIPMALTENRSTPYLASATENTPAKQEGVHHISVTPVSGNKRNNHKVFESALSFWRKREQANNSDDTKHQKQIQFVLK